MQTTQLQQSNLKLIWGTRKPFLATLGLLVGGAALVFFLVVPQATQAYDYFLQWQEAQELEETLQVKLQELNDRELAPEFSYEKIVSAALPEKKPLFELMQSLSMLSQETNVKVGRFELSPGLVASQSTEATNSSGPESLEVDYTVTGSFENLNAFMRRVEEVTPFSTIVNLNIGSAMTEDPTAVFSANISSETYYFAKSVATKESTSLPKMSADAEKILQALQQYAPITIPTQSTIIGGEDDPFGETLDLLNARPSQSDQ